jgi:hypothetical protein
MRLVRKLLLVVIGLPLVGVAILVAWCAWQRGRDPMGVLDRGTPTLQLLRDSSYGVGGGSGARRYHDVVLFARELDTVRFSVSLPAAWKGEKLPVVLVLGGLEIGRQSLKYVQDHGRNALVAYEYPYGPDYWYEGAPSSQLPAIRRAVLRVPAQMAAMTRWAASQPWADSSRIVGFSYSFGATFLPAFYRVVAAHGIHPRTGVMIYGGADIEELFRRTLKTEPLWWRDLLAWGISSAIYPIEPAVHLPYLRGEFLIINGKRDELIPEESARKLRELTPEPKTVIELDTEHMQPNAVALIAQLVATSRQWLVKRGAINP